MTIANGFMYAAGGYNNVNVQRAVYYARVNADGTLGAWNTNATQLQTAREYNSVEALNGYLYVLGGQASLNGAATANVEVAALNANGSVGTFSNTTALPGNRGEPASEVINGLIYVFGGGLDSSGGIPQTSVFFTGQAGSDATPPTVSVTAPAGGSTLTGTVNVNANAADNVGVIGVQFLLDDAPLGAEDTTAPYSVSWNTTTATNAGHTLTARARDVAGNQTTSAAVAVTVNNPVVPPPPATLLTAYAMNEGTGTTTSDTSASANNAALTSTTWTASGRYGNGLQFNGTTSRARSAANVSLGTSFTYEAWILNPGVTSYETIMTVGSNRDLYLLDGTLTFWNGTNDLSFGAVPTGSFQHVAVTYDGTTIRAYLNGAPLGAAQTTAIAATSAPLQVGAWIGNGTTNGDFFGGTIDEVRVYNGALNQAGVQTDMATPIASAPPPPDNTPPVLSGGQPSGQLAAGTTQATLQVTTNENATCRYGTVAGTGYAALANTFSTTGGTTHTTVVNGLTNGTAYTFYVRCQDTAGNATTADFPISFSVAAPDGVNPTVSVTAPANNATVSGTINVTANAADNVGVVGVQFLLDGNVLGAEDTSSPYSVSWNTTTATNAGHSLTARARDAAGNQTTSAAVAVTVNNVGPPPAGPLLSYGLNQGAGTSVTDSSGNNRTGTLTSGTWTATGQYGGAVVFNGTTTRIRSNSNVTLGTSFTLEGWVFNTAASPYETFITVGSNRDLYLDNGVISFDNGATAITFGAALPTNAWRHVAVTYDGTTMRAYVNGALYGNAQAIALPSVTAAVQIGAWIFGNQNADYFSGTVDEIRVYSRALSAAEVQADMSTPIT